MTAGTAFSTMRGFTPFSTSFARFCGIKLMSGSFFVGRFTAFARDFALLAFVHGSKTALAIATTTF
jgi:hypothetical protein